MATRIYFAQARPIEGEDLYLAEPDLFRIHLHRCFGDFPLELDKKDIDKLTGMAATWTQIAQNPYETLIKAIKRYQSVKIWAEYPTPTTEAPNGDAT